MKKYDVGFNITEILNVYIEKITETRVLVAIPQKEWSYLIRFDLGTSDEFEYEHNEMVRSLYQKAGFPYNQAENLADLIEGWI